MSAKYKSPSFLLPNELNTSANPANDTGVNSLYSMDFDGNNEYIDVGNSTSLQITGNLTISMWFKTTATTGYLISDTPAIGGCYSVLMGGGNGQLWARRGNGTNAETTQKTSNAYNDGNWHNIVFVSDSTMRIYIDGVLDVQSTVSTPSNIGGTTTIKIGDGFSNFAGQIDEVAIFNRALNITEIAALYDGTGSNIRPSNLMATDLNPIAYYPLGEQAQNSGYLSASGNEWQFPNGVLQDYVMDFDGTDDYIDTLYTGLNGSSQTTISFWLNTSNINQNAHFFGNRIATGFSAQFFTDGNTYVYLNGQSFAFNTSTYFSNNTWHNFVIVFNGSLAAGNRLKAYVDNTLITFSSVSSTTISASTSNLLIGYSPTGGYFNGKLSNFVLWNSDQSTNIDNIYNNGSPQTTYTVTPQNWWKLNADSVYTPSAPNYTTALDFVASESDYVEIANSSSLNFTANQDFSLSAWFKKSSSGWYGHILKKGSTDPSWLLRFNNNNKLYFLLETTGGVYTNLESTTTVTDTEWHHVVAVADRSSSLKIYLDGFLNSQNSSSSSFDVTNTGTLRIGAKEDGSEAFDGEISNASVFNTALTQDQVSTLFNFGTPETNISFSPQAWWKLDNITTGIQDSSGNGNNGTNNGATQVSSPVAVIPSWKIPSALPITTTPNYTQALDFDGADDYIDCGNDSSLNFNSSFSVSVWIKGWSGTTNKTVVSKSDGSYFGWSLHAPMAPTYANKFIFWLLTDVSWYSVTNSNNYSDNTKWVNLIAVFNNSTNSLILYSNNVSSTTTTTSGSPTIGNTKNFLIGTGGGASNRYYTGSISNLSVWNTALTSAQVSEIYNEGVPSNLNNHSAYSNLVSWWKLDNLTTGLLDSGSASNNGTVTGASTPTEITSDVLAPQPVNGLSTTLPSTALQQSDLQFDSPYSNYSLSFDGTGNKITSVSNSGLTSSDARTFSAWIKTTDTGNNRTVVQTGPDSTNNNFELSTYGGFLHFSSWSTYNFTGNVAIADGDWHFICITFDGSVINGYVDGNSAGPNLTNASATLATTNTPYYIGGSATGNSAKYFNGKIDEASVFNYALSSAQVLEIYNNGKPSDLDNFSGTAPISWWRLGENAYFDNNIFTVPNSIAGAPNGTGSGTVTSMLSADAPGTYANSVGDGLAITDRVGDAPLSVANSQSYNMIPSDISPYVPEYVGKQIANNFSMSLDGTNDYIDAGDAFTSLTSFSISAWFKSDITTGFLRPIISTRTGAIGASKGLDIFTSSDILYGRVYDNGATEVTTSFTDTTNWHHVVLTYNGTTLEFYLDGSSLGTSTGSYANSGSNLLIGKFIPSNYYFDGSIDEVAIFDTALNAGQIYNDLYQPTATGTNQTADLVNNPNLPNPVAWYRMGD